MQPVQLPLSSRLLKVKEEVDVKPDVKCKLNYCFMFGIKHLNTISNHKMFKLYIHCTIYLYPRFLCMRGCRRVLDPTKKGMAWSHKT